MDGYENLEGNARFQGMVVDLLELISDELGFEYKLYLVPDGNFGSKMPNGEWNGMIGEVLNGVSTASRGHVCTIFMT